MKHYINLARGSGGWVSHTDVASHWFCLEGMRNLWSIPRSVREVRLEFSTEKVEGAYKVFKLSKWEHFVVVGKDGKKFCKHSPFSIDKFWWDAGLPYTKCGILKKAVYVKLTYLDNGK